MTDCFASSWWATMAARPRSRESLAFDGTAVRLRIRCHRRRRPRLADEGRVLDGVPGLRPDRHGRRRLHPALRARRHTLVPLHRAGAAPAAGATTDHVDLDARPSTTTTTTTLPPTTTTSTDDRAADNRATDDRAADDASRPDNHDVHDDDGAADDHRSTTTTTRNRRRPPRRRRQRRQRNRRRPPRRRRQQRQRNRRQPPRRPRPRRRPRRRRPRDVDRRIDVDQLNDHDTGDHVDHHDDGAVGCHDNTVRAATRASSTRRGSRSTCRP